jgi:uncharacterized protein
MRSTFLKLSHDLTLFFNNLHKKCKFKKMLLEFSVGNYRSIKDIQTLDLRATGLKSDVGVDSSNIFESGGERVLKVIGIYGPNGSGKSNVLKAFQLFRTLIRRSLDAEGITMSLIDPFKLSDQRAEDAGYFQVLILLEGKKYRYGFTLTENGQILQEWLNGPADRNETWYFRRTKDDVKTNEEWFKEGVDLPPKLRADSLFLSFASAYDGEISGRIRRFIAFDTTTDVSIHRNAYGARAGGSTRLGVNGAIIRSEDTNDLVLEGKGQLVLDWLKKAGLDYGDIHVERDENKRSKTLLYKYIYDVNGKRKGTVPMRLDENESAGTQKFYLYIGRLYYRFNNGGAIFSDEIDNNFHPFLLIQLVRFFNDPEINKAGAQLIFTSHDTNLLQPDILRRDQIYFTEKSAEEATILYALSDLKGIRNNADFARQYLAGFYGALPLLQNLRKETNDSDVKQINE